MRAGPTKDKGVVPVRVSRKAVARAGESEAELAGGAKWVGGEVILGDAVEDRPGREGRKDQATTGGEGLG